MNKLRIAFRITLYVLTIYRMFRGGNTILVITLLYVFISKYSCKEIILLDPSLDSANRKIVIHLSKPTD